MSIKDWLIENYESTELKDMIRGGCINGVPGLTYYHETTKFYNEFVDEIWELLYTAAEDQGVTILELIGSFNGGKDVGSDHQLKNLLAWFAAETVAPEALAECKDDEEE